MSRLHHTPVFIFGLLAVFAGAAFAQSARPGGAARTTASSTRSTAAAAPRSGASASSRSNSGGKYRSSTEIGDAIIQIDPETRSLIIVTDEDTHQELNSVIKNLDRPKPQVLIKVVFLEITYNKGLDLGLEGSYTANLRNPTAASTGTRTTTTNNSRSTDSGGTRTTTSTLTELLGDAAVLGSTSQFQSLYGLAGLGTGSFVRLVNDDWNATLRMLATRGKLEVLSRPSIMARNNQEAVIVVGSEVPFITNSRITDLGQTINTIQYDNVGIILRVTPFITSEGTVEMIVAPEISTLTDQTVPISNNASAPVIAKRSAETVVVTPHGQTVVIGGLMETQKTENVQKIPLLGDIPLLGAAFRRTIKADSKRELLIFLTPYIVRDQVGLAKTTQDEMSRAELPAKAFPGGELEKFLDDLPLPTDGEKAPPKATRVAPPAPTKTSTTTTTTTKVKK